MAFSKSRAQLRTRIEGLRPLVIDVALVVVVGAAISITISAASEPGARDPNSLAYGHGLMMATLLLGRRRWPLRTLLGTVAILTAYYWQNFPGFVPAVPLAVPLYSVAATGRLWWPLIVSVVWVVGPLMYRVFAAPEPLTRVINDTLGEGAFFAVIVLLGVAVRGRRAYAAEVGERLQRAEAESERVSQELKVARLVQQQFLPDELPDLPGWRVEAFYRSAREVGGDFYSFIELPTGELGIAIGDVTDKGAPAALVMATTQGLLGAEAPTALSPSAVLEKVNEVLVLNTPEKMFVTCQYIVLDPTTGRLRFANAGHNLPYLASDDGVVDLRATGMPLGLMPASGYEPKDALMPPGTRLLLHSDGLAEAHNPDGDMFGFPRVVQVMENCPRDEDLIDALMVELERFTGANWEQEDDITLVTLERLHP
ncbi:MAG: PP2C family protein-serine/threonine phosphatase [Actinomycetota bacterium]|nr:PP2C family protein-serine/threonine phosphatase [Actinomycetota bacterium]